jgi:hypothetical protein
MAVEVIVEELARLGHGPVRDEGEARGGYLRIEGVPHFTLSVNEAEDGKIRVEYRGNLESEGVTVAGQLGVMNLAEVCRDIHRVIERDDARHQRWLGRKEEAERDVTLGISRLHCEFNLRRNEVVAVDGWVEDDQWSRFTIIINVPSEDEAREVLRRLAENGLISSNRQEA